MRAQKRRILQFSFLTMAVAGLVNGLRAYSSRQVKRSVEELPPLGQFIEVGDLKLHYIRGGQGRPIVMIHGLGGVLQDFASSIFHFLALRFDAIAYDRPGYGFSKLPKGMRTSIPFQARVLHEALVQLGIEKPLLVGHSLGGSVALQYAAEYPTELAGLVLIAPVAYPLTRMANVAGKLAQFPFLEREAIETLVTRVGDFIVPYTARHAWAPNPLPSTHLKERTVWSNRPTQYIAALGDMATINHDVDLLRAHYPKINVPTTIITGDSDQLLNFKRQATRLSQAIPNSRLIVLPQTGHMVQFVHPERVAQIIEEAAAHLTH